MDIVPGAPLRWHCWKTHREKKCSQIGIVAKIPPFNIEIFLDSLSICEPEPF